ncbi:hypothetical protein HPP92_005318 [Vanilla planifolia]|uniref:Uncharacterized protein n=1 Tax=Vanilla planifolia TaxID=51239 RepID=A0A835RRY7_VANPL|nr:hypothetical protein HPP92_005613 [Vanilla planifolia]KAG0494324.1 hypothetical protein HPP92_005318 [Vanilla planifolia]
MGPGFPGDVAELAEAMRPPPPPATTTQTAAVTAWEEMDGSLWEWGSAAVKPAAPLGFIIYLASS